MNAAAFLAITSSGVMRVAQADARWTATTVLREDARCLSTDPLDVSVAFAGTQDRGVWRSTDGGATWRPVGLTAQTVKSLAVSRAQPGTVFAGTKPAMLYVSDDGGDTWMELRGFRRIRSWWWFSPAEPPFTAYVQAIALSPNDPNVIVAGIEAGAVVRSGDGGRTWSGHRQGAMRDCHSLAFHATDGRWAYQGGTWLRRGPAAYSRDGGITWMSARDGADRPYGWAVAADCARPEVWYVSAAAGIRAHGPRADAAIYRSVGGANWQRLRGGLPEPLDGMPYALLTDPSRSGTVYAGLSTGEIWASDDFGDAWTRIPVNLPGIHRLVLITSVQEVHR
ncbi:MAG TPA: hypothetical protein VJA65_05395 [bacterium]|nr:hypothetical protein [bacterium]